MASHRHHLDRTIDIHARPETVFRFLTDPARWASWWGAGSTIDARPGGRLLIRYPGGVEAAGEVVRGGRLLPAMADARRARLTCSRELQQLGQAGVEAPDSNHVLHGTVGPLK